MRVIILFAALIALSTVALAQDKNDSNFYDFSRQWRKPTPNFTVDEQLTAVIKRHMANLLYPVDMSSLAPPDKDPKFHDLIVVLQQQMEDAPTGVLTLDEFNRLTKASHDIDGDFIGLPNKQVFMSFGNSVSAQGTETGGNLAEGTSRTSIERYIDPPINFGRIFCSKQTGVCVQYTATFNLYDRFLFLDRGNEYQITDWTSSRVTAQNETPCFTVLMTVDIKAEQVTTVTVPRPNPSTCSGLPDHPITRKLVDGFGVAWKISQEKMNEARKLVYPAASALLPIQN